MVNEKHLRILRQLRDDSRMSLADISRNTGLATSTVFDYYQELTNGTILRHTTIPDFSRLGYPLRKKFIVRANDREKLFSFLTSHPSVNNLYRVDRTQALCEAFFKDVNEVEEFKHSLKQEGKAREVKEFDVLEVLKHEAFQPSDSDD